ncbi:hypothetical protein CKO32_10485 [Afifella marina DSM 2698]|nr:hypothetical protein [Afifella marina DSM 2698]MBK1627089.1 hypothetical protein [Afifella marina]
MVGDHQSAWSKPSAAAEGEAAMRIAQGSSDRNHIDAWRRRYSYVSGKRSGADWNFETPNTVPSAETPSLVELPENAKRELYEYPARAMDVAAHERMEKLRMQASEADHDRVNAGSNIRVVEPGRRFAPYEVAHPEKRYEEHVVIRAVHQVVDRSYETAEDEPEYRNAFEAMPSRIPLTPHRTTKRPRIEGAQVGIVAGPEGEEIHCDQYGRVKLWFPWDRRAKKDGSDTCWVRVSQSWAGGTWGGQIIPRIGMEAMVSYIDGDPDRPLITGLVPNPRQKVPYELPTNKTRSVFKSNTHKGAGFNELSFEDENNLEEVFVHAQRDMNVRVLRNRSDLVHRNQSARILGEKFERVDESSRMEVRGNLDISVGDEGNFMGASTFLQAGNTFRLHPETYEASRKDWGEASGAVRVQAQGDLTLVSGNYLGMNATEIADITSTGHVSVTAGRWLSMESQRLMSIQSGSAMRIRAMDSIRLVNAAGGIIIDKDGNITLYGKSLKVETSGPIAMTGVRIDLN